VTWLSTHRKVISYIHLAYRDSMEPFSIHDLAGASKVSVSSVTRTLRVLVELKLVAHRAAYAGRNYRVSYKWSRDVKDVIEMFELYKIISIPTVGERYGR